jgi:hypothetical protein
VVYVGHKSPFTAGKPLKNTSGRLRALSLQPLALPVPTLSDANYLHPAIPATVVVGCDIDKAQVNTQRAVNVNTQRNLAQIFCLGKGKALLHWQSEWFPRLISNEQ